MGNQAQNHPCIVNSKHFNYKKYINFYSGFDLFIELNFKM